MLQSHLSSRPAFATIFGAQFHDMPQPRFTRAADIRGTAAELLVANAARRVRALMDEHRVIVRSEPNDPSAYLAACGDTAAVPLDLDDDANLDALTVSLAKAVFDRAGFLGSTNVKPTSARGRDAMRATALEAAHAARTLYLKQAALPL